MRPVKKCGAILVLALAVLLAPGDAQAKDKFKIAWSIYVGWMPWGWAADQGIVKKWADKYGIEIEVVQINDYVESINQYTAGGFDGCVMTNMDALTIPAVGGVDSTALIVGDFSNGNDGIVSKTANYTVTANDGVIECDATSGAITLTLPAVSGAAAGTTYTLKKTDSSANAVIWDGNASETIDGATTVQTTTQWASITIIRNTAGTAWLTIKD